MGEHNKHCLHCRFIAAIHEHFAESRTIDHNEVIGKVAVLLTEFLAAVEGDRMDMEPLSVEQIKGIILEAKAGE